MSGGGKCQNYTVHGQYVFVLSVRTATAYGDTL